MWITILYGLIGAVLLAVSGISEEREERPKVHKK